MPKKAKESKLEELCRKSIKVSVSWEHLFELHRQLFDVRAKEEYDARIKMLLRLGVLDYRRKGNYQVRTGDMTRDQIYNPYRENTILYFTKLSDAEKVSKLHPHSNIERYIK